MASVTLNFYHNQQGSFVDFIYDDATLQVTTIHIVVPSGANTCKFHLITKQPNRSIDADYAAGTDTSFPPGINLPITIGSNWRGEQTPQMPWLVEFAIGIDGL